jgi:hypothetical protein
VRRASTSAWALSTASPSANCSGSPSTALSASTGSCRTGFSASAAANGLPGRSAGSAGANPSPNGSDRAGHPMPHARMEHALPHLGISSNGSISLDCALENAVPFTTPKI